MDNELDAIDVLLSPNEEETVLHPRYQELVPYRLVLEPIIRNGKVSLAIPIKVALSCGNVATAGHILLRSSKHPSTGMLDWHDLELFHIDPDWFDLPDAVGILSFIGLSSNSLRCVPAEIFKFPNLVKLQIHHNRITQLPSELFTMPKLKHLDVSFNLVSNLPEVLLQHTTSDSLQELNLSHNQLTDLPSYFKHSGLHNLDLSCNKLQTVPACILQMRKLHTLNLSGNIGLKSIPYELGALRQLMLLSLDKLPYVCNLPSQQKMAPLTFLKQRAQRIQHVRHFDVVLVGLEDFPQALDIISKHVGVMSKRKAFSLLKFSTAHQFLNFQRVFALPSSTYVVIWDCQNGQSANSLLPVILHLSIYAPSSVVIVVACWWSAVTPVTEADVREQVNKSHWRELKDKVKVMCVCVEKDALVSRVHTVNGFLSALENEAVRNVTEIPSPKSYFFLTDVIQREVGRCRTGGKAPLISEWDLWELVRTSSQYDLVGHKEFPMVISFLSLVGSILHLPSGRSDTVDYYVLDRQWFLELVSALLSSPKGTMNSDSGFILPTCLIDLFDSPLLQNPLPYPLHVFASQQGLAISVNSAKSLVPSMLRTRNTGFLSSSDFSSQYQIRRIFSFRLTPSSFWGKLISHLLINVGQLISSSAISTSPTSGGPQPPPGNIPGEELANWNYWRKGIVVWIGGYLVLSVEASTPVTQPCYHEGLEIRVANTPIGVQAMNVVTATISTLLINWYWEVWETVEVSIPCPVCVKEATSPPTLFPCAECFQTFCQGAHLKCPNHAVVFLPSDLVPDLIQPGGCEESLCFLTLLVNPMNLIFNVHEKSACLSQPPSETVFRGQFGGREVAVKTFPPSVPNPARARSAESCFLNFFHEFTTLSQFSLNNTNPFIISMIVASCDPLCLVFPYASYGSLEEVILESHITFLPLLRVKIIHQLSMGLEALHAAKIIHRHVCLANILVFSLSLESQVNIKLGGFSEACVATQQGLATGMSGAFPAPEMCNVRAEYDERVDVFAFAFTSFEILTRKKLYSWQGVPFQTAASNNNRPSLTPISSIAPYFAPLLERCWEKDLNKRPFFVEIAKHFHEPLHVVTRGGRCINPNHELHAASAQFSRDKAGTIVTDVYLCSGVLSRDDSALLTHLSYPGLEVKGCTSLPSRFVICMCCTQSHLWVSFQQRYVRVYSTSTLEFIREINLSHHARAMTASPSAMYLGLENGEVQMYDLCHSLPSEGATVVKNICGGKPVKALEMLDYWVLCVSKNLCYRLHQTTLEVEQQWLTVSETEVKCAVMARDRVNEQDFLWVSFRRSQQVVVFNGEDGKAMYGMNCSEVLEMEGPKVWVLTMCVVLDTTWVGLNTGHILCFSAFSSTPLLLTYLRVHTGNVRQLLLLHPGYTGPSSLFFMPDSYGGEEEGRRTEPSSLASFLHSPPKCLPVLSCGQGISKPLPRISSDGMVVREENSPNQNGLFAIILEGLDARGTGELEAKAGRKPLPYMEGHRQRHFNYSYERLDSGQEGIYLSIPPNRPERMETLSHASPIPHGQQHQSDVTAVKKPHERDPCQDPALKEWEIVSFSDAPPPPLPPRHPIIPDTSEIARSSTMPATSFLSRLKKGKKPKEIPKKVSKRVENEHVKSPNPHPTSPDKKRQYVNGLDDSGDEDDAPYITMKSAAVARPRLHTVAGPPHHNRRPPPLPPPSSSLDPCFCHQEGHDPTAITR